MAFPLPPDFHKLFRRERYVEPALTGREALVRAILLVAGTVLGALMLLLLPHRPFSQPQSSGVANFIFSVAIAVVSGIYCGYQFIWRPWRDGPPGYRLVGEFVVKEKNHLFSKCWVLLAPGTNFQVAVTPELYERLQVGSQLRLTYTIEGALVSLTKLG